MEHMKLFWVLAGIVLSAFCVITGFVFVFSVNRVLREGIWCPWYIKVVAYLWLVVGWVSDAVFNTFWGTLIFRELPQWQDKELMFSSRVKRHCKEGEGWRLERAALWASFLNAVDPGHV